MDRDEKILDYIDGLLSAQEADQVREKLTKDSEWKAQYDSFLALQGMLKNASLLSPSISFTNQVMANIDMETQMEGRKGFQFVQFFQVTGWLWLALAILVFSDLNNSMITLAIQQWVRDFTVISKSSTHVLFGNSDMLWAFGVLLLAYITVVNYTGGNSFLNEMES